MPEAATETVFVDESGHTLSTIPPEPTRPPTDEAADAACTPAVIALDPGHNGTSIEPFDDETGAAMIDYPNGAEDTDDMTVATTVQQTLTDAGYEVILVKENVTDSVDYRERINRAETAGAVLAVSIHTSPGFNAVFPQRVGGYREGTGADGTLTRVEFTNAETAERSQRYAQAIATQRTEVEGHTVSVVDNDFGGRPPLWGGNLPIISLLSDEVPWVYSEYGLPGLGGSYALPADALDSYAAGLSAGIKAAIPVDDDGCATI